MRPAVRRGIAVLAVVGIVGTGYAAYAANADGASYRTATATVGSVEQTLNLSGTLEPAGRADLAFATSGTVEDVKVEAGDTVKSGAVLGTLDDTTLRKNVQQARATLAAAKAQLEDDESSQADTVSSATTQQPTQQATQQPTQQPTQEPSQQPTDDTSQPPSDALADLAAQQQAVTDAQSVVSASMATAKDALAAQQAACENAYSGEEGSEETDQACADALTAVQTAQEQVSTDQDALQVALDALSATLTEAIAQLQTESEPTAEPSSQPSQSTTQPSTGGMSTTVTAATLAKDQASIDQAEADLLTAKQELRMATVTAPFGGEVVEVDVAAGDSVASGTDVFVLVARGTTTVEVAATSTQIQQLKVGQNARVTPTGSAKELDGTVTQISSIPDDSGSYPVTITLDGKNLDLATGLTASVAVVTGRAKDVVTVPASAVSDGVVQVVEDGTASRVRVTTGVTGETSVEVADGLESGDVVVLADLDQAIPSSDDQTTFGGPGGGQFRIPSGGDFQPPAGFQPPSGG